MGLYSAPTQHNTRTEQNGMGWDGKGQNGKEWEGAGWNGRRKKGEGWDQTEWDGKGMGRVGPNIS